MSIDYQIIPYILPFKKPFHFGNSQIIEKKGFLVKLFDGENTLLGDCAIFPELGTESIQKAKVVLTHLKNKLSLNPSTKIKDILNSFLPELEKIPASRFAIEQIIHHLELIENTPRDTQNFTLKTNAVLGLLPLKKRISQTQSIIEQGYTCLKCKISSDTFDNDLEYLNELFKLIPPEIQIRLDANGSFNKDNAQQALKQLEKFPIEYIEDICTDSDDIIMLSKQTKNSLAIDKGINTSDNMAYFMDNSSISTFIYKPVSAGGFFELKKFLSQAGSKNAKIIISSSFEHPLGLEYLKVMASYLELPGPHGLAVSKFYDYSSPISEKPEEHYDQKIYLENIQKLKINCKGEYSFA